MSKPKRTFISSSTNEAAELGWELKRITDSHEMRQRRLMEEYRNRSHRLTEESQKEQSAAFDELRQKLGVPDEDWGDGSDWNLNIENLADGTIALVHNDDLSRSHDNCRCPACQLRRALGTLTDGDNEEDEAPVRFH